MTMDLISSLDSSRSRDTGGKGRVVAVATEQGQGCTCTNSSFRCQNAGGSALKRRIPLHSNVCEPGEKIPGGGRGRAGTELWLHPHGAEAAAADSGSDPLFVSAADSGSDLLFASAAADSVLILFLLLLLILVLILFLFLLLLLLMMLRMLRMLLMLRMLRLPRPRSSLEL